MTGSQSTICFGFAVEYFDIWRFVVCMRRGSAEMDGRMDGWMDAVESV